MVSLNYPVVRTLPVTGCKKCPAGTYIEVFFMQCQVQEVLRGKVVKETQKLSLTIISSKALIDFTISNAKIFTYILILVLGSTSVRYVVYVSDWNIPSLNLFYHQ